MLKRLKSYLSLNELKEHGISIMKAYLYISYARGSYQIQGLPQLEILRLEKDCSIYWEFIREDRANTLWNGSILLIQIH